jgi:hypothetical protein
MLLSDWNWLNHHLATLSHHDREKIRLYKSDIDDKVVLCSEVNHMTN